MLSSRNRLRDSSRIREVVRRGERVHTSHVTIYTLPGPQGGSSRVACVVGKKAESLATRRHRFQRWLRSISRDVVDSVGDECDIVLVARPSISKVGSQEELRVSMRDAIIKKQGKGCSGCISRVRI